jgi:hypothetical protein
VLFYLTLVMLLSLLLLCAPLVRMFPSVKKFPTTPYWVRKARHQSLSWARWIQLIPTHPICSRCNSISSSYLLRSRNSAVGIATGYGLDDGGVGVRVPVGSRNFSSPRRPDLLWGPLNLLLGGYRGLFPRK